MNPDFDLRLRDIALTLLRIVAGVLIMQHGAQKLFGLLGGEAVPSYASMMGVAGAIEFVGGLLVLIGLFTRGAAFLLSGQLAVAYFLVHLPNGFWPIANKGELAALYSFIFLYLAASGGGPYSFDALLRRGRAAPGAKTTP